MPDLRADDHPLMQQIHIDIAAQNARNKQEAAARKQAEAEVRTKAIREAVDDLQARIQRYDQMRKDTQAALMGLLEAENRYRLQFSVPSNMFDETTARSTDLPAIRPSEVGWRNSGFSTTEALIQQAAVTPRKAA